MLTNETARTACEQTLIGMREYNIEHHVLPSETEIIDRLIYRRDELSSAYLEICEKLHPKTPAFNDFWGILISTAAHWNPSELKAIRSRKKRLQTINDEIAVKARDLSDLLRERSDLVNLGPFDSDTHYHVLDVLDEAAAQNGRYTLWIKEKIDAIHRQFDMKYWPTLSDFMRVISNDAHLAEVTSHDPVTEASTTSTRHSKSDFFRAFWAALDEQSQSVYGRIPDGFRLSDETTASLGNCALNLDADDLCEGPYIKRIRQRDRESPLRRD